MPQLDDEVIATMQYVLRTATRALSANCPASFCRSLRRSSLSGGIGMRTTLPSLVGLRPRLALRMDFSTAPSSEGSKGCARIIVGSGMDSEATWLSGMLEP